MLGACHRRQPAVGGRHVLGRVVFPGISDPAVCPRPDADVVLVPPIGEIVPAFGARPRVIGDLVRRQSGGLEYFVGDLIERRPGVGVGQGEGAGAMRGIERRAFLDGQLVDRQMIAGEVQGARQFLAPRRHLLARAAVDQIERGRRHRLLRQLHRGDRLIDAVARPRKRRLSASSACTPNEMRLTRRRRWRRARGLGRGRVGFEGNFDVAIQRPPRGRFAAAPPPRSPAASATGCRRRKKYW